MTDWTLYSSLTPFELGFDIYDIGDTDEEDVGFYFDDVSMSRSDSGMDILKQFDETVKITIQNKLKFLKM